MKIEDYPNLRTELDGSHPVTGAYNVDDLLAVDELNLKNITRIRASMSGQELLEATDSTEYAALTDAAKSQWLSLCAQDTVNPEAGGVVQQIVVDIFGGGATTVTTLAAARQETISRAEELGFGTIVIGDVQNARAL